MRRNYTAWKLLCCSAWLNTWNEYLKGKLLTAITLTQSQARRFLLAHQGLWPPRSLQGKLETLEFIRRVGCIQFDPLDITGQNAELVLQSRLAGFTPWLLRDLLYHDRLLLDGWDKNMAIYPLEDWPYFHRRREAVRQDPGRSAEELREVFPRVRAAIAERGPLSSLDFDFGRKVDWWWAPTSLARAALESLYFQGELVIHHKVHTRKVYDLAQRHIPSELLHAPEPNPSEADYHDWYMLRRIGSFGLLWNRGSEGWLGVPAKSAQRTVALRRLLDRGAVLQAAVEGLNTPLYLRQQDYPLFERMLASSDQPLQAAFLAPLDNLLWDRRLLKDLFGFEYRWEVYKPQSERQYGYYVLPVLYGDRFIARFEPVRQKKDSALTIKNWWWEPGVVPDELMLSALRECFEHFFSFLNIKSIRVDGRSADPAETEWLVSQLAASL